MALQLVNVLGNLGTQTVNFLPNIVSAIIILIIGLIVGKILGKVVREVLERINLDYFVTEQKKPVVSITDIFVVIIRWWIYLAFIAAAVSEQVLGIATLSVWVSKITNFIPNIVGAAVILVVGYALGEYIKNHIKKTETIYAHITGKVFMFFVLYVAIAVALPVLGIPATLVNNILLVIIGSIGLGVAIALGLGLHKSVDKIAKKYVKKMKI
mgnify:CR=1 FL=1